MADISYRTHLLPTAGMTPRMALHQAYLATRQTTESLAAPLTPEDQTVQAMPDASPTKWHLAHTSWFFETFLLQPFLPGYTSFNPTYGYLFNSYYDAIGERHPRSQRGLLSRPTVAEVLYYRAEVDTAMADLLAAVEEDGNGPVASLLRLGIHHEQQHQELILTDILNLFARNPLHPAYRPNREVVGSRGASHRSLTWIGFPGGVVQIGHPSPAASSQTSAFAYDNESPRHDVLLRPFRLASRLVTNGEWQAFIDAGGYRRADLWLADGWAAVDSEQWEAPLYWLGTSDGGRRQMTLHGLQELEAEAPVCNVSFYEADAFARWSGKRLPSEAEWEVAAMSASPAGNMLRSGALQPLPAPEPEPGRPPLMQMFGDVWEWTASPYLPYPGYTPASGAVGEYNGKFMCNQMVLRGGSCLTPDEHIRASYRNFFYPYQRWQMSGVRLAEDVE
ncbi:ergothioneine biosynthesis protein EgtB [Defluviicoccus vanus]|uniref:Ergothioneine biosynthesis protein EgtB n=1 Tax=Defluviicoccus vanus TaxID=111831 RepID=A0A7H1N2S1_9PROT|nr:ergothioneine biosynthesis protein EgtB [Defluviicoccus vanus]QNT70007.1 ergothioneine biosynthesis protein EgtB [Defluviicoccus vanus]